VKKKPKTPLGRVFKQGLLKRDPKKIVDALLESDPKDFLLGYEAKPDPEDAYFYIAPGKDENRMSIYSAWKHPVTGEVFAAVVTGYDENYTTPQKYKDFSSGVSKLIKLVWRQVKLAAREVQVSGLADPQDVVADEPDALYLDSRYVQNMLRTP